MASTYTISQSPINVMAFSLYSYSNIAILLLFLALPFKSMATSHHHHSHHIKSLHFSLYIQDTLNKTDYIIVKGVAGAGMSETTSPFGTVFVYHDPLTVTPNKTSKVAGTAQGTTITSSLDGLDSINAITLSLNVKGHKGSISIFGVASSIEPSDVPVVGGTGDFLFVHGYVKFSLVSLAGISTTYISSTYKIEFHLYWPPYAISKAST